VGVSKTTWNCAFMRRDKATFATVIRKRFLLFASYPVTILRSVD